MNAATMDTEQIKFANNLGEEQLVVRTPSKDNEPSYGKCGRELLEFVYTGAWDSLKIRTSRHPDRAEAVIYAIEFGSFDIPNDRQIQKVHERMVEMLNEFVYGAHTEVVRNYKA
jgi:hypothetical protein